MLITFKNKDTLHFKKFFFKCAIGKNGFASNKKEGDKKTPKGTYEIEGQKVCPTCEVQCSKCKDNASNCLECAENLMECHVCYDGYFSNGMMMCEECIENCAICVNAL